MRNYSEEDYSDSEQEEQKESLYEVAIRRLDEDEPILLKIFDETIIENGEAHKESCPICFELFQNMTRAFVLSCGHQVCMDCFVRLFANRDTCVYRCELSIENTYTAVHPDLYVDPIAEPPIHNRRFDWIDSDIIDETRPADPTCIAQHRITRARELYIPEAVYEYIYMDYRLVEGKWMFHCAWACSCGA